MDYHIFKKAVKSGQKTKTVWYYWYYHPVTKKQVQKVCKGCKTKWDAELFVSQLPKQTTKPVLISDIAADMYIPGSMHCNRREQLGKSVKLNTLTENRRFIKHIIATFGGDDIRTVKTDKIINYLVSVEKSASWKNQFLGCLMEIYEEAAWNGLDITRPYFPKFKLKPIKSDIFTLDEIDILFQEENFSSKTVYMLFKLTLSAGLRISEARAFRPCQLLKDKQMVVIDGFLDKKTQARNNYNKTGSAENPRWRCALLPIETMDELSEFVAESKKEPDQILFTYENSPFRIEYLRKLFNQAIQRAGLSRDGRKLTMHSLRYTYVTRMRSLLDADTVRKMVGHTSVEMTDYYTRATITEATTALLPFVAVVNQFFKK